MVFIADVRTTYSKALWEAGREAEKQNIVEVLDRAEVELSDDARVALFPNKDKIIRPGFIELQQYAFYVVPCLLLQSIAILLTISARKYRNGESESIDSN